jgi:adenine/guanine phosphoribosyltransferase-like PRPP-binding protein
MQRRIVAQKLIDTLEAQIRSQLNLEATLIVGVVLKGLPVAYAIAKKNDVIENFVPIVAQRQIYMQHSVESYFPSLDWKTYYTERLAQCENLLVLDDVVNSGFTRQRVESIIHSLNSHSPVLQFGALILNKKNLANPSFVSPTDFFAKTVNAKDVECDWGMITVPLWDQSVEVGRRRCEDYYRNFWLIEKRVITLTY